MRNIKLQNTLKNILFLIMISLAVFVLIIMILPAKKIPYSREVFEALNGSSYYVNYNNIGFLCNKGEKQITFDKDNSLKISFECLGRIDKIYQNTYKLKNNNILFVNFSNGKDKLPTEAKLFNTKTNKLEQIDLKIFEEPNFVYGKTKIIPSNKEFITKNILYNIENNRFYKIPAINITKYNDFINEEKKEYKNIKFLTKFQDGTELFTGHKYNNKTTSGYFSMLWLEDRILLKRYKAINIKVRQFV